MTNFEPFAVIINPPPSSVLQIYPGQTSELSIVVNNQDQDSQGIVVEVYLDIPERLRPWCNVSRTSFNLDGGRSQSVEFIWQIPTEAIPNRYRYDLVVDSPSLRAPLLYTLELEVLTPIQTPVTSKDPTLRIEPQTSSTNPIELKTKPLIIQALVHNRSNLVDDFRLTCPDLDDTWYTVRYPEGIQQQGLISGGNKLSLNPNTQGQITLLLHPPENTISGHYRPTIRLHSTVKPDLLLQDIFYLYIPPIYQINFQIQTIREKIKQQAALYQVVAINEGNTIREIKFKPGSDDEAEICQYQIDTSRLKIPPGKTIAVGLKVKPTKRAGRPLFGAPKPINFKLDVEDLHQFPLPAYLPLKSLLLLEARPIWQLLLLLLSGVITLSGLAFLIWWLFFKPPILPEIVSLEPTEKSYKFGQEIKLNLDISNPQRLKKISLVGKNPQGGQVIEPLIFTIEQLQKDARCQLLSSQEEHLSCKNISTGAKEPNSYIFNLTVWGQKRWRVEEVDKQDSPVITLAPPPTPTISNVGSPKNQYVLPAKVDLKFDISEPQELERVDLIQNGVVFASIIPSDLSKVCKKAEENTLNCYIQIPNLEPGNYILSVDAVPKNSRYVKPQGPVDAKTQVIVQAQKIPLKINVFTLNNKSSSPIILKPNQNINVIWDATGKNVKVTISVLGTPVAEDLPGKGKHLVLYEQLPINELPVDQLVPVQLMVTDADGATKNKTLLVKMDLPKPSPTPSPSTQKPSPSSSPSSNLKIW
ncbi:hypothetical protein [Gloeothece verrucosa]|uniref:Uncharacterized protein n=1 Tax=Gloeothece verrucosa (strain PCC 7822) TaxID=497965 RepID=E0UCE5_GLOV7|nr:hypothetical protein [Gloeothece verrucosa]ADN14016.1 conserved hypothetical protein [Gloeothece verrucosa PCC 7822]